MSRTKEKTYWAYTYRFPGLSIYAWERLDRGGRIFVKFADGPQRSGDARRKVLLGNGITVVRDSRGTIDKRCLREIEDTIGELAREILGGTWSQTIADEQTLSLTDGFDLALDLQSGKYATRTRRWDAVQKARIVVERILGKRTRWVDLAQADLRKLWRTIAAEAVRNADGQKVLGVRKAESTVDALLSVAAWLREESRLPTDTLLPMPRWRTKLKEEWADITKATVRPMRHRNTTDEMRALFRHAQSPGVDPRFSLAFQLGGEQRIGQVIACMRSDLELTPFDGDMIAPGAGRLGILRVPGKGNKQASPIMLNLEDRNAIDAALRGYLSLYEDEYRNGRVHDFPLFPSCRLKRGKAKLVEQPSPLSRDAARKMFLRLERIAGVEHLKGRGWYGVRRTAADIAEDVEKDERVLNSLTGHRDSRTRQTVYQDQDRPEVLVRAAQTRSKVRGLEDAPESFQIPVELADAS